MQPTKPLPSKPSPELSRHLDKNLAFHAILESQSAKMRYGQISVTVVVKDGIAQLSTLSLVLNQRIRY